MTVPWSGVGGSQQSVIHIETCNQANSLLTNTFDTQKLTAINKTILYKKVQYIFHFKLRLKNLHISISPKRPYRQYYCTNEDFVFLFV